MEIKINDSELMQAINAITVLTEITKNKPLTTKESGEVAEAIHLRAKLNKTFLQAGGSWER